MERQIPNLLTVEDLRRDPDLIFAVHTRGRRIRSVECGQMLTALYRKLCAWRPVARVSRATRGSYRLGTS